MTTNTEDREPALTMRPALLTAGEIDFLLGKKQVSAGYERKLKHDINRKLQTLNRLELPLLADRGFSVTAGSNNVTISSNAQEAKPAQSEGSVNLSVDNETSPRRDSDARPKVLSTFKTEGLRNLRSARLSY